MYSNSSFKNSLHNQTYYKMQQGKGGSAKDKCTIIRGGCFFAGM